MGRPTGWWSGPPHICSAGAAAASAAGIGVRIGSTAYTAARAAAAPAAAPAARRRTGDRTALLRAGAGTGAGGICGRRAADRAGRLLAAGIAAPLLDEVWEYEAAEAAVAGRSHFISLHKRSGNVCSRVILCRKCLNRAEKQQNPDGRSRPGIGCKNRNKTQRLENFGARRAAFKPYSPDHDPKSPVFMRVFGLPSLSKPIGKPTKSRNFWCRLTQPECSIHNAA